MDYLAWLSKHASADILKYVSVTSEPSDDVMINDTKVTFYIDSFARPQINDDLIQEHIRQKYHVLN